MEGVAKEGSKIGIVPARLRQRDMRRDILSTTTLGGRVVLDGDGWGGDGVGTHRAPSPKRHINPSRVLPCILRLRRKGIGTRKTSMSKAMFVAAWAAHVAKKTLAFLLPQATHVPSRVKSQFLARGRQDRRQRRKKMVPQVAVRMSIVFVIVRASLTCMSKRRRYWKRMESLMKVAAAV